VYATDGRPVGWSSDGNIQSCRSTELPQGTASFRSDDLIRVAGRRLHSATLDQLACGGQSLEQQNIANRNESVPTQLAQCWFLELAISSAIMLTHFSNKIYGSSFVKPHSGNCYGLKLPKC